MRFASAVQAALNDGFRVFGELAPHPLLTHAVDQNASSLDMPIAALASMRREQDLPVGLRGFVADLHSAGAAPISPPCTPRADWWMPHCRPGPTGS